MLVDVFEGMRSDEEIERIGMEIVIKYELE